MDTPEISDDESTNGSHLMSFVDSSVISLSDKNETFDISMSTPSKPNVVLDDSMLTPRKSTAVILSDSSDEDSSDDVIDINDESDNEVTPRQTSIKEFMKVTPKPASVGEKLEVNEQLQKNLQKNKVSPTVYKEQLQKVDQLRTDMMRNKMVYQANKDKLPDKGDLLLKRYNIMVKELEKERQVLDSMEVQAVQPLQGMKGVSLEQLEAGLSEVVPRTFGKQAIQTLNTQKALTMERLEQLHGSLKNCPTEEMQEENPEGLKVELMVHQKHALAWLLWREKQKPRGGILADDMGLGKTLTMISLILKSNQIKENKDEEESDDESDDSRGRNKYKGGTLVVCPASLLHQWDAEVNKHVRKNLLSVHPFHGASRETKTKRLAKYDIVITTYSLVLSDHNRSGHLFGIKWDRIILDEAHQVRNHKSQTSVAVCNLASNTRWALTGTPVHNKELDLYALIKFLRCSPFDDLAVWKRWVTNKATGGQDRLNTLLSSIILRRTKQQLEEKQMLTCLPEKTWKLIEITMEKNEMDIYQRILILSQTLFAEFLYRRADKNGITAEKERVRSLHKKFTQMHGVQEIHQHHILVLLLRLRQACCHPSLLVNMLEEGENTEDIQEKFEDFNLLDRLQSLKIDEETKNYEDVATGLSTQEPVGFNEACKNLLNPSNPIFSASRKSSKIEAVIKILEEVLPTGEKVIIISQWTKFLEIISAILKEDRIKYYKLDGSVPVSKRMDIVQNINSSSDKVQILLLSLTAGGVGLNLVGANNIILLDLHWNPQLELQAQDRIYRVGQTRPVKMYKLMCVDSIEEKIKQLQDKKLTMATELLTGARIQQNKLSLDDLKMLFSM